MRLIRHKLAAATAVAAAFCLAATPAWAVGLPRVAGQGQAWDAHALDAEGHGHRGGHHGGWGHDDDWDIDGDDVLAGVLILGGIAAISAIANSGKHREQSYPEQSYPEPAPYPDDAGYQAPPEAGYRSGGMSAAVDTCVAEVEAQRGAVGSVDRASRSGEGWYVAGDLEGGTPFACWVDGSGQVTNVRSGDTGASYDAPAEDPAEDAATTAFVSKQRAPDLAEPAADGRYELAQAGEPAN